MFHDLLYQSNLFSFAASVVKWAKHVPDSVRHPHLATLHLRHWTHSRESCDRHDHRLSSPPPSTFAPATLLRRVRAGMKNNVLHDLWFCRFRYDRSGTFPVDQQNHQI